MFASQPFTSQIPRSCSIVPALVGLQLPPMAHGVGWRGRRDGGRRRGRVHLFSRGRRPPVIHREGCVGGIQLASVRSSPRHGTNVTMMSRAAHGRFEHVAASQHRRLREARGRKGKAGRVVVTCENARATRTTPHLPEREGETVCVMRVQWAKCSLYGQATAGNAFVKGDHRLADPQSRSFRHASP